MFALFAPRSSLESDRPDGKELSAYRANGERRLDRGY